MLNNAELIKLLQEEKKNEVNKKPIDKAKEKVEDKRKEIQNKKDEILEKKNKESKLKDKVKKHLVSEALLFLYENSCNKYLDNDRSIDLRRNLINNYVNEKGAINILSKFETKSYVLSEMASVINEYYNIILEKMHNEKASDSYTIDMNDKENFFDSLNTEDLKGVSDAIKQRVAMSMEDFVISNNQTTAEIKEILNTYKDKESENIKEEIKEDYQMMAKKKINNVKYNKKVNIVEAMIYKISNKALIDEDMKKIYTKNSQLDMDRIVEDCETMYTFLEMLNTAKIEKIDENYILKIINNLA